MSLNVILSITMTGLLLELKAVSVKYILAITPASIYVISATSAMSLDTSTKLVPSPLNSRPSAEVFVLLSMSKMKSLHLLVTASGSVHVNDDAPLFGLNPCTTLFDNVAVVPAAKVDFVYAKSPKLAFDASRLFKVLLFPILIWSVLVILSSA